MIVLRKPSLNTSVTSVLVSEELIGVKDGTNQVYTTGYNYKVDRINISYNGQLLISPNDFKQTRSNEITFIYIYPTADDNLTVNYQLDVV